MPRKNPDGFKELIVYKRAVELYDMTFDITARFPTHERRRREQMESCARSVKQNIVEGWKRETTRQYIDFLSYSFGSLGELKEDYDDCVKDKLISSDEHYRAIRKCGEVDYLMRRLKESLERRVQKQDYLSPYQGWLGKQQEADQRKEEEFRREMQKIVDEANKKKGEMGEKGQNGQKRGNGI